MLAQPYAHKNISRHMQKTCTLFILSHFIDANIYPGCSFRILVSVTQNATWWGVGCYQLISFVSSRCYTRLDWLLKQQLITKYI